jgi:hypothetical protein
MKTAVQASQFGIKDLTTLFKFASVRARETGQSVDYLVESLVMGIGKQQGLILDNLNINVKRVREEFKLTGDYAGAVAKIINEDMAGMDEDIGELADETARMSVAWKNASDNLSVFLATIATVKEGEVQSIWQALIPTVILENFAKVMNRLATDAMDPVLGMTEEVHGGFRILIDDFTEFDKVITTGGGGGGGGSVADKIKEITYAMAELNVAGMETPKKQIDRMGFGAIKESLVEIKKIAPPVFKELDGGMSTLVVHWDELGMGMVNTFSTMFTEVYENELVFFDNMLNAFRGMLEKMASELLARAAIFGMFSIFGGGGLLGGLANFVLRPLGITGVSPAVGDRGGSTSVNINMPNVTMINSRSISQINQALTRHRRLH